MAAQDGLLGILAGMTYEVPIHKAKDGGYFFGYRNTGKGARCVQWINSGG